MIRDRHDLQWPGLYVEVDPTVEWERPAGYSWAAPPTMHAGPGRLVHVMSKHARGEIRAYVLDAEGRLHVRPPCYTGEWTVMDREVGRVLGATVAPYVVTPGGWVECGSAPVQAASQGRQLGLFGGAA